MNQHSRGFHLLMVLFCFWAVAFPGLNVPAYADLVFPSNRVTSSLKVRAAPDSSSAVTNSLLPGSPAVLLDSTNYWHHIELPSGGQGYVSRSLSYVQPDLRLGAWNIKKLGHGPSKDYSVVAAVINENFDILTVIEVMQKSGGHPGYDSLRQELGASWAGLVTTVPRPNTAAGDAEFYAILYRSNTVRPCKEGESLQYFQDNDGSPTGTGHDLFVREPAFACFETITGNGGKGWDFMLAAYHATWADGDEKLIKEEVMNLPRVFEAMRQARPGEKDLLMAGDFNLTPDVLDGLTTAADRTVGSGSTLNNKGARTKNLYDHLLVLDSQATGELVLPTQALDVRIKASSNKLFYKTISDHLPIMGRFVRDTVDDD